MHEAEHRTFAQPDELREFPHGRAEIVKVGNGEVGRYTFEPGWRWSNDVKPVANTASCEAPHFQYHVSGQLAIPRISRSHEDISVYNTLELGQAANTRSSCF